MSRAGCFVAGELLRLVEGASSLMSNFPGALPLAADGTGFTRLPACSLAALRAAAVDTWPMRAATAGFGALGTINRWEVREANSGDLVPSRRRCRRNPCGIDASALAFSAPDLARTVPSASLAATASAVAPLTTSIGAPEVLAVTSTAAGSSSATEPTAQA